MKNTTKDLIQRIDNMKRTFIKIDKDKNIVETKRYACGGCGKKRRKNSKEPWAMLDKHEKIIWRNSAFAEITMEDSL